MKKRSNLGKIFGEEIEKNSGKGLFVYRQDLVKEPRSRIIFFVILFLLGMVILSGKLVSVVLFEGARLKRLSLENRIREYRIFAPRGIIYDRNKIPLVRNVPVYIGKDGKIIKDSSLISKDLEVIEATTREYIDSRVYSGILGYIGEVSEDDLLKSSKNSKTGEESLSVGDFIGKMGIEKYYDKILRGTNGREMIEVDATGKTVRTLGRIDPVNGKNLILNIDSRIQNEAAIQMEGKKGAVVVTDPSNGRILALFSSPSFDSNRFIKGENVDDILGDPDKPLFNRAIGGLYPPGSTFKIVTALAALESGTIKSNTAIEDTGVVKVGDYSYANWYFTQYGKTEGMVDMVKALQRSNDVFFYKVGELTGIDTLAKWGRFAGVGKKTGIDLEGEGEGLMPDPSWQRDVKGSDWFLGNTYHISIGQGDLLTTPLQVNTWTNIIANGGKLCTPYLSAERNTTCSLLGVKKENIEIIHDGMKMACQTGGTGWPLFNFKVKSEKLKVDGVDFLESKDASSSAKGWINIPVACKTGTAEFGDPKNKTHAWFTAFAPVTKPEISVTVIIESGGEGSSVAAPIAKKILEKWFTF